MADNLSTAVLPAESCKYNTPVAKKTLSGTPKVSAHGEAQKCSVIILIMNVPTPSRRRANSAHTPVRVSCWSLLYYEHEDILHVTTNMLFKETALAVCIACTGQLPRLRLITSQVYAQCIYVQYTVFGRVQASIA